MSKKNIKKETKKVLSPAKIAGLAVGLVFVIIVLIISICHTSKNKTNNKIQANLTEDEVKQEIENTKFIDVISRILQLEDKKASESEYITYYVGGGFNYSDFVEPDNNEYTLSIEYLYPEANDINIFNMKKEFHIIKTGYNFEIETTKYAVNAAGEKINDRVLKENYQYCYLDDTFKFTNEDDGNEK